LASRIVSLIPPHDTYVEPFAGGAAVYFKKPPSPAEVLNDKDSEIAHAFRFLRDMTPGQFEKVRNYDWVRKESLFRKLLASKPTDDLERFCRYYYLKKASFASGSERFSEADTGRLITVDHLWRVHERLKRSRVFTGDAIRLIGRFDSPKTFFYLDPPYPGRGFPGTTHGANFTDANLERLVAALKDIKGRFMLSLAPENAKLLPVNWWVRKVKVRRMMQVGGADWNQGFQYEIIASNYDPWSIPSSVGTLRRRRNSHRRHRTETALAGVKG